MRYQRRATRGLTKKHFLNDRRRNGACSPRRGAPQTELTIRTIGREENWHFLTGRVVAIRISKPTLKASAGVLAQLVERLNGIEEVTGSNPVGSKFLIVSYLQSNYPAVTTTSYNSFAGVIDVVKSKFGDPATLLTSLLINTNLCTDDLGPCNGCRM